MFKGQTPAQKLGLSSPKEPGDDIPRPFAKLCTAVGWMMLVAGVMGFLGNIEERNGLVFAFVSLISGVVTFALLTILGEISTHLAHIRGQTRSIRQLALSHDPKNYEQ